MTIPIVKHRIFYHCFDTPRPTGGQKSTYQHVDVLNDAGFEAYAVHSSERYRLQWFDNNTRVITWTNLWRLFDPQKDIMVLPENLGPKIFEFPGRKVIFNKNIYYGYRSVSDIQPDTDPYSHPDLLGVLVVSGHNQQHLQFAYPDLPIFKVIEYVDARAFPFVSLAEKKRQGAYVSKLTPNLLSILHSFTARACYGHNAGKDFKWVLVDSLNEQQVSAVLRDSLIVLFPSVEEGLGRFPIEALLSGCIVLGPSSGPCQEFLPPTFQFPYGDAVSVVEAIERIIVPGPSIVAYQAEVEAARLKALTYSKEAQAASVSSAWNHLLARLNH